MERSHSKHPGMSSYRHFSKTSSEEGLCAKVLCSLGKNKSYLWELACVEEKVKTNGSSFGGSVSLMQDSAVVY